jgi:2,4-dienoyl-CoA reductase-like NADH-dependent reductase (Old Yellow Enzyme family)
MLERAECDLAALGRALIVDPDWVRRIQEGKQESLSAFSSSLLSKLW